MLLWPCLLLFALWCLLYLGFQPLSGATWSSSGSHRQLPQSTRLPWHSGAPLPCVSLCVSPCAQGHLVLPVFDVLEDIQHGIIPFLPSPAQSPQLECIVFSKEFYQTEELKSLSIGKKMHVSFHYRSPCWKIKGEIPHYRRTTVAFTLVARSKKLCNYRGRDKWDFWDKYEWHTGIE